MGRSHRRLDVLFCCVSLISSGVVLTATEASADSHSSGPLVYSVNPWDNGIADGHRGFQPFDAFTGENIGGAQIVVVGGAIPMSTVDAASGIAIDPLSGVAYVLLKGGFGDTQLPRVLATLDLTNGEATTLGNTTKPLTNLAFGNGVLYGTGGRSGNRTGVDTDPSFGHLFTISTTNGSIIDDLGQLTNCPGIETFESCGHAIAFNSDDGELYHMSGPAGNQIFERVVLSPSFTVEPLTFTSSTTPDMVLGMGWDGANDRFIMTDWNTSQSSSTPDSFSVTVDPFDEASAFALPKVSQGMKGLAISTDPVPTDTPPVAVDDVATVDEGDNSVQIDVLANDINPDAGTEFIESVTQPANGSVGVGSFDNVPMLFYSPNLGYCNDGAPTDDFTYTLNGGSPPATVFVTVNCVPFIGPLVFAVQSSNTTNPYDGGFEAFDAGNGQIEYEKVIDADVTGSAVTGDVDGATALTSDPRNGTLYATLDMNTADNDVLATIDPLTGEATTIADTQHTIVGLTFGTGGVLYGVSDGNDPSCVYCLFTVNTNTGSAKVVKRLTVEDESAIAFNPVDKKIYRATDDSFHAIDPARSFRVTEIGYGGSDPEDVMGLGYDPAVGGFVLTDYSSAVWRVNPLGGAFEVTDLDNQLRGVVVSEPALSIKYSPTKRRFTGKLLTPGALGCDEDRDISVWRDVAGPDVAIGQATTDETGAFVLSGRAKRGRYFATVDAAPPIDGFPCPDARSKTIAVR
jgi:hypothetical protein